MQLLNHFVQADAAALQQLMPEPDTATIWVTRDGTILSAGPVFTDWFAFTAKASMVQELQAVLTLLVIACCIATSCCQPGCQQGLLLHHRALLSPPSL
jgi:hypothetical protein